MGKLKRAVVMNWKREDPQTLECLTMKRAYAKEPNSQFVGKWTEKDLKLKMYVSVDDGVLHMSMSHPTRYPTWDEISRTRYKFFSDDIDFVMYLPKKSEYVNIHENCFHLYQLRPGNAFDTAEIIGELVIKGAT